MADTKRAYNEGLSDVKALVKTAKRIPDMFKSYFAKLNKKGTKSDGPKKNSSSKAKTPRRVSSSKAKTTLSAKQPTVGTIPAKKRKVKVQHGIPVAPKGDHNPLGGRFSGMPDRKPKAALAKKGEKKAVTKKAKPYRRTKAKDTKTFEFKKEINKYLS